MASKRKTARARMTPRTEALEVILVEFGTLSADQQRLIDGHPQRALGAGLPPAPIDNCDLIAFAVEDGTTLKNAYQELRGWAIGHALPIRRLA
jgi:hypothetical protein